MDKDVLEKEYWKALTNSTSGCWLLRNLIRQSRALQFIPFEGGGKESYNKGQQDLVFREIVTPLRKNLGWQVFDRIMAEER